MKYPEITIDFYRNGKKIKIGYGHPTFVIAEGACNHMCDMGNAIKMVDKAVDAGADAIKWQSYKAEKLVAPDAMTYWKGKPIKQIDYYSKLDKFGEREYREIFSYCEEKEIIGFSTPFDVENAYMLQDLQPLFKIASCCITDFELLEEVASFGKPIILSIGGAEWHEIDDALMVIESATPEGLDPQVALLFCTFGYPTSNEKARLGRLPYIIDEMGQWHVIGFSDHTYPDRNMIIPSLAVALGARIIEKHYTLDSSWEGSGHFFSVNPDQLKEMVINIRLAEEVCPSPLEPYVVMGHEAATAEASRKRIVATNDIPRGKKVSRKRVDVKRSKEGEHPGELEEISDATPNMDIAKEEGVTWSKMREPKYGEE